jgi:hypothetical protein
MSAEFKTCLAAQVARQYANAWEVLWQLNTGSTAIRIVTASHAESQEKNPARVHRLRVPRIQVHRIQERQNETTHLVRAPSICRGHMRFRDAHSAEPCFRECRRAGSAPSVRSNCTPANSVRTSIPVAASSACNPSRCASRARMRATIASSMKFALRERRKRPRPPLPARTTRGRRLRICLRSKKCVEDAYFHSSLSCFPFAETVSIRLTINSSVFPRSKWEELCAEPSSA